MQEGNQQCYRNFWRGNEGSRGGDVRGNEFHGGLAERGPSESDAEAGTHSGAFSGYFGAYPAIYRSTGVTTFIVNQNGIVYQKDLGPDTEKIADEMTDYDPDSTWERVD